MAKSATVQRIPQSAGQRFANNVVSIETAAPASRTSLRATTAGAKSFEKSLGFPLPRKPGETTSKAGRHALWLGPDEWLLIDEKKADETMVPRLANQGFSAVDLSHRNVAYLVSGAGAANTLNAACPRDLSLEAFPVSHCSRTLFGKAEIIIHRTAPEDFRVECWRSFAPYVWGLLLDGAKDAHV